MKWMLSIVAGALLMTVAIGITQTVLLMRLTRETTAQQHRIEQMMQNQQAAMASLLDTHLAMANAAAANAASDAAASAAPPPVATPAHGKRSARTQYAHKPKVANSR
jgi:septal ring factor EnvC (AmiA/AmiB activator)